MTDEDPKPFECPLCLRRLAPGEHCDCPPEEFSLIGTQHDGWRFHTFHKPEMRRLPDTSEALLESYRAEEEGEDA